MTHWCFCHARAETNLQLKKNGVVGKQRTLSVMEADEVIWKLHPRGYWLEGFPLYLWTSTLSRHAKKSGSCMLGWSKVWIEPDYTKRTVWRKFPANSWTSDLSESARTSSLRSYALRVKDKRARDYSILCCRNHMGIAHVGAAVANMHLHDHTHDSVHPSLNDVPVGHLIYQRQSNWFVVSWNIKQASCYNSQVSLITLTSCVATCRMKCLHGQ